MSVLQALDRYYVRMAARGEVGAPGYSRENISFAVVLSADGKPTDCIDLRENVGKRLRPRLMAVPAAVKRTSGIATNILWDKTAYVLGRSIGKTNRTTEQSLQRTAEEHAAFTAAHLDLIATSGDAGLIALRRFLETWTPDRFDRPPFATDMLDTNLVFRLDGDDRYLHDRPAARELATTHSDGDAPRAFCLITGEEAPIERLHPTIKGVDGAQSSGASLVSFNNDAFASYGKEQGENAPTSQAAAFRYGAALNSMLERGGANRLRRPIGDATVVFWADTSGVNEDAAQATEALFDGWFDPPQGAPGAASDNDAAEASRLRGTLDHVASGRPLAEIDPRLMPGVRFHVLGLSPNASRLSIRYWLEDSFEGFARRLAEHHHDLAIEPRPWRVTPPSVAQLLAKTTALREKFDNIPPLLAGEVTRAILTGAPYPRSLLAAAIIRVRAGDDPSRGWHAAAIKAVLSREHRLRPTSEETPVSLDRDNPNQAYQLGRMFAALETAQRQALGRVNATIRDRYFGAASATPAGIFPLLLRGVQNHLGKLRKEGKGGWIEREIEEIFARLPTSLPRALPLEAQGRFVIGYYHQRSAQFAGRPAAEGENEESEEIINEQ